MGRRAEFLGRPAVSPPHAAPAPDCECGLYAWYAPNSAYARGGRGFVVTGAIAAWGRIEAHWQGFRAQFAQPVALAWSPDDAPEQIERTVLIAAELELACVPLSRLEAEARRHGSPVPPELRPPPPAHVPPYARALALAAR
jgi:hypothetical protein